MDNKQIMAHNIQFYMDVKGVTRKELCKALNFKYSTFCEWMNATVYPRIDSIEKMAHYFGINKSALVEERTSAAQILDVKDPDESGDLIYKVMTDAPLVRALLKYYTLSDKRKQLVMDLIDEF